MRSLPLLLVTFILSACVSSGYRHETAYSPTYPPPSGYYESSPYRNGPPPGYYAAGPIAVARATYGTWKHGCDATRRIAGEAAGRHHFRIRADNGLCGDPHQGKDKTLNVSYHCGAQMKSASAAEGQVLFLSCP